MNKQQPAIWSHSTVDSNLIGDELREECGVFGIFGHPDAPTLVALGLQALQHRGQEAAGIVTFEGGKFYAERRMGLVSDSFTKPSVMKRLLGNSGIGHVRYSTTGETVLRNVQPLFADLAAGGFALAHNGNLTNALTLRRRLEKSGAIFQSTSDTETILHLIAHSSKSSTVDRVIDALYQINGAYALVGIANDKLIGVRDPLGIRPLVLGQL
ncbi:MAG: class II glutamine amidotransferase, partial [Verrucomicrobiota bacterium]|nr:class II glutamine amidotransferase [Verrucomicrobiota bacterium]